MSYLSLRSGRRRNGEGVSMSRGESFVMKGLRGGVCEVARRGEKEAS